MNPVQPIPNLPRDINVTAPIGAALERVKQVLFRPFDLGKWFTIGFCAWLALLGEQGGGGGGGGYNLGSHHGHDGNGFLHQFERVKDYTMNNLVWIVPVVVMVILFAVALGVLFLWLKSRGKFMFLHCVALNKGEVVVPWERFAREAGSLFWFQLVLSLIGAVLILPLVALIAIMVIGMVNLGRASLVGLGGSAGALLLVIALATTFFVVRKLTTDFVVPIMFLRRQKCLDGWRELRGLFTGNAGSFILYFLFQIVIGMVISILVLVVILLTCCLAGCLLALPYLGTVLFLPVLVFLRASSLYYLAQFGPDYDVFRPGTAPSSDATLPSASAG